MKPQYERMLAQQAIKARYRFALGALIIRQGQVVGAGYNRAYHTGKAKRCDCAELLALKKTPKSLRPDTIVVVARVRKNGSYGMAKPCLKCQKSLGKAGVKKAYYTSAEGWVEMKL